MRKSILAAVGNIYIVDSYQAQEWGKDNEQSLPVPVWEHEPLLQGNKSKTKAVRHVAGSHIRLLAYLSLRFGMSKYDNPYVCD